MTGLSSPPGGHSSGVCGVFSASTLTPCGGSVPAPMLDIQDIFGTEGPLARHLPGFKPRAAQIEMAAGVAEAVAGRTSLVVEAGTGTGKTFAYLIPALLAGARVLVSTGTRTLQDQLFGKDVPLVAGALGRAARIALLKGRSNYLCVHRLSRELAQGVLEGVTQRDPLLARIESWSRVTRTGDLAEVPGLTDSHPVWGRVTSTRDNCLGQRCPDYASCHLVAARREAQAADLVIVNHHLLLADLALKEDGFGDLLGSADAIILDEAHQIPELATIFFGSQFGSRQVEHLATDARAALGRLGLPVAEVAPALRDVESAVSALLAALPRHANRVAWEESGVDVESFALALASALRELGSRLESASSEAPVQHCARRAGALADVVDRVATGTDDEGLRTTESNGRTFTLGFLPFDVSERFAGLLASRPAAWIFTSATLAVGQDFSHFTARLGLGGVPTLRIPSPFDHEQQALLYLPEALPDPSSADYTDAVVRASIPLLDASRGGAFLLFTSHRALARAAAVLRATWEEVGDHPVLVQGEGPRERLLRDFRNSGNAILLGTSSFWEGVDVKGQALRLVIIEKLPFASPEEPMVKARIEHIRRLGGNPFAEFQLPGAVLALKQGVGRLIRSEDDRGVIAICDPRLTGRPYGRLFRGSLPPMPVTRDARTAAAFLRELAP
jgi:ATP-dependent DNA helicase DinG